MMLPIEQDRWIVSGSAVETGSGCGMTDLVKIFKTAGNEFLEDDCMSSGAAIAYYTIFSLPPLLAIVFMFTTMIGFSEQQVNQVIRRELGIPLTEPPVSAVRGSAPAPASASVDKGDSSTSDGDQLPLGLGRIGIVSKIIGFCILLFSATGVFGQLQYSLDKAWEVKPDPEQGGFWRLISKRLLSVGIVVVLGFLLSVSLVLTTLLDEILKWGWGVSASGQAVGIVINELISLVVYTLLFAAMFKVLPDAKTHWRDMWFGAAITALLFEAGKFIIGWYLDRSQVGSDWGDSAGSVIGALVWVYYSSLILLYGAELTQVWIKHVGSGIQPADGAIRVVTREHQVSSA